MTDRDDVAQVAAIADRAERLRAATEGLSRAQRTMTELARLRRALVQEMHAEGWTYSQIADAAGLSRGRVHQVRHQGPAPEGAFLGHAPLTIATPLKREERAGRPVVAAEDVTASQRLADLAQSIGFGQVSFEQIPLDGSIDLNREGLIVICGPRISPDVAQLLARDRSLSFEHTDGAWTLHDLDSRHRYRSGLDDDPRQPADYAYLARMPRPDRRGDLLVFTGIHPSGTLGVVHLLANDLAALHSLAAARTFSMLLQVRFDPDTAEPITATMIGEPRWQDFE